MKALLFKTLLLLFSVSIIAQESKVTIEGPLKKWHKITLNFEGDELSESDEVNPFLNYRLNVYFKNNGRTFIVPGFFAADGNASETSATSGNIWKVRFMPDNIGEWTYTVSFRKGDNVAVNSDIYAGDPTAFDGVSGKFTVTESDKSGSNFRTKGRLTYTGERYLKYSDTEESFLKAGADSPENFLGYYEFDQTPPTHKFEPHAKDWKQGDPTWQNGKGKNIIGALNYLASKGMNSVYFLTMNVQGDGKDVWPWTNEHERYRFDCSKLDQWEIVFDHMDDLGLMLHIVTQETENELLLDIGETKTQRKLYYRELIARFSHHLGITWNLGEENGPLHWTPKGQTDKDRKEMAKYLKDNDPYQNYISLHTHATPDSQDLFLTPLLGFPYLDGPSLQTYRPNLVNDITVKWIKESRNFGRQWVVTQDEIGPADTGAKPDADDPDHDEIRAEVLWGNLMAGGAGVEWYFGYKFAHNDLNCEDWRSRENLWNQTRHAVAFFHEHLPFETMYSANSLTKNEDDYVLAKEGDIYAIYLPKVEETHLDLSNSKDKFSVKWYNPRTGGALQNGSLKTIKGGENVSIGFPPSKEKDWVAIVQNTSKKSKANNTTDKKITLKALEDFQIDTTSDAVYYTEEKQGTFAIKANKKDQRDKFATAYTVFKGDAGFYSGTLNAVAENDGESEYILQVNNEKLKLVSTLPTPQSFKNTELSLGKIYLKTHDTISISSKAVSNGRIPEHGATAWSRGRWRSLTLTPSKFTLKDDLMAIEPFEEKDGLLTVEAEDFHYNSNNESPRKWYVQSNENHAPFEHATNHSSSASGNAYIEALPDTRATHKDKLVQGENFYPMPGTAGVVSYKIKINNPGTYYVWVRAYSSGPEDNGLHVGVDGTWPESGQRIQLCQGKHQWTWSSAQRVPENHCGYPQTITLTFEEGEHIVSFSMREDGFELDKWMLVKDKNYIPE